MPQFMEECEPENVVSFMSSSHLNAGYIIYPPCRPIDRSFGQTRCIYKLNPSLCTQVLQPDSEIFGMFSTKAFHGRYRFAQDLFGKFCSWHFCRLDFPLTQPCRYCVCFFYIVERNAERHFQLLVQIVVFPCSVCAYLKKASNAFTFSSAV